MKLEPSPTEYSGSHYRMLLLEEVAVEAGPKNEPMESSKKLLLLPPGPTALTLVLVEGWNLLAKGLLKRISISIHSA